MTHKFYDTKNLYFGLNFARKKTKEGNQNLGLNWIIDQIKFETLDASNTDGTLQIPLAFTLMYNWCSFVYMSFVAYLLSNSTPVYSTVDPFKAVSKHLTHVHEV